MVDTSCNHLQLPMLNITIIEAYLQQNYQHFSRFAQFVYIGLDPLLLWRCYIPVHECLIPVLEDGEPIRMAVHTQFSHHPHTKALESEHCAVLRSIKSGSISWITCNHRACWNHFLLKSTHAYHLLHNYVLSMKDISPNVLILPLDEYINSIPL